jgi:hypothetical protein
MPTFRNDMKVKMEKIMAKKNGGDDGVEIQIIRLGVKNHWERWMTKVQSRIQEVVKCPIVQMIETGEKMVAELEGKEEAAEKLYFLKVDLEMLKLIDIMVQGMFAIGERMTEEGKMFNTTEVVELDVDELHALLERIFGGR